MVKKEVLWTSSRWMFMIFIPAMIFPSFFKSLPTYCRDLTIPSQVVQPVPKALVNLGPLRPKLQELSQYLGLKRKSRSTMRFLNGIPHVWTTQYHSLHAYIYIHVYYSVIPLLIGLFIHIHTYSIHTILYVYHGYTWSYHYYTIIVHHTRLSGLYV